MTELPHFAIPLRFKNGAAVVNDQDTLDDLADCIQVIMRTPIGHRIDKPDFGIHDPAFRVVRNDNDIMAAIDQWEPRVEYELAGPEEVEELVRTVRIMIRERPVPTSPDAEEA